MAWGGEMGKHEFEREDTSQHVSCQTSEPGVACVFVFLKGGEVELLSRSLSFLGCPL